LIGLEAVNTELWYHPESSRFYLTALHPLSVSGKLTGTLRIRQRV
jgi:hypothetical protein